MFRIRRAEDRGQADHGWLQTQHTFSFADYFDPAHMGFRSLRVINDDHVQPGAGFPLHGHRDMEIITYVLEGVLEHRDTLGNGALLRPGELQHMSAGTGVRHSEFNPSRTEPVHLYQIWVFPDQAGLTPSYEQKSFVDVEKRGGLRLAAGPAGSEAALTIHQDARIYLADLAAGQSVRHEIRPSRHAWLQVLRGEATVAGTHLRAGDGLAVSDEPVVEITGRTTTEVMLFDLA